MNHGVSCRSTSQPAPPQVAHDWWGVLASLVHTRPQPEGWGMGRGESMPPPKGGGREYAHQRRTAYVPWSGLTGRPRADALASMDAAKRDPIGPSEPVGVAVIGAGAIAQAHLYAFQHASAQARSPGDSAQTPSGPWSRPWQSHCAPSGCCETSARAASSFTAPCPLVWPVLLAQPSLSSGKYVP